MVKKFTRVVNEYADETALMAAVHKDVKPGRPIKGQQSRGSYAIAWGDLRRIWFGLKAAGRCPVDERAHDAIKDALVTLQRRTNGALELAEDDPLNGRGPLAGEYEIAWPGGETEVVHSLAAVSAAIGVTKNYVGARLQHGPFVKRIEVWDSEAKRAVTKEITVRKL